MVCSVFCLCILVTVLPWGEIVGDYGYSTADTVVRDMKMK